MDFGTEAQLIEVCALQAMHEMTGHLTDKINTRREPLRAALNMLLVDAGATRNYL